ncbi:MAG TPA: hypothetical protein VKM72_22615 [Thermoanaerobaculia bacterium]|nr:hypothetical protein [Thermoanaerobaculia bacterium]
MRTTLRIVLVLTLALALPAGSSAAPGAQPEPDQSDASFLLDELSRLILGLWSEIGCHIDPDGLCRQAPSPQSDIGCHIDPNGACRD